MRIEQLEYLLEISKNHSLNITSQKLHISHQCLSKSISSLEQELGITLLERSSKGICLTKYGQKTVEVAKSIVESIGQLKEQIDNEKRTGKDSVLKGQLSIVASHLAANAISSILNEYTHLNPLVNIRMTERDSLDVVKHVADGQYDVGVTNLEANYVKSLDNHPTVGCDILFSEKSFLICGKNSAIAKNKSISMRTFLKQSLIVFGSDDKRSIIEQYGRIKNCIFTNNRKFYYDCITSGTHVAIFTNIAYNALTSQQKDNIVAIPLKTKIIGTMVILTAKDKPPSLPTGEFISLIKRNIANLRSMN
jgi:Transcriptional regulator